MGPKTEPQLPRIVSSPPTSMTIVGLPLPRHSSHSRRPGSTSTYPVAGSDGLGVGAVVRLADGETTGADATAALAIAADGDTAGVAGDDVAAEGPEHPSTLTATTAAWTARPHRDVIDDSSHTCSREYRRAASPPSHRTAGGQATAAARVVSAGCPCARRASRSSSSW